MKKTIAIVSFAGLLACGTDQNEERDNRSCQSCESSERDLEPIPSTTMPSNAVIRLAAIGIDYDQLIVTATRRGDAESSQEFAFGPDEASIEFAVEPGNYQITLDYYNDAQVSHSSSFCDEELRKSQNQKLTQGLNEIQINVCDLQATLAQVLIEPILHQSGE